MTADVAVDRLIQGRNTQFDKEIVDCFVNIRKDDPVLIDEVLKM